MNANTETVRWSRRYQVALRKHLKPGLGLNLEPATRLGQQAVALGLEPLDVARIHEHALTTLALPGTSRAQQRMVDRAKRFFAETVVPIEKTHREALKTDVRVNQLTRILHRRTMESSVVTRHLERGITQRRAAEAALKKSREHRLHLLRKSSRLQQRLRVQAHEIFAAQENERHRNSRELQNEIAQILLAINLRLLTVKASAKSDTENLEKEIVGTQELVRKSVSTIQRLAHELGGTHET